MSLHTPTPWRYHEQGDANHYCILANDNRWVLGLIHNGEPLADEQRENMRRIVACVNACEGIDIEYLESADNLATFARRMMLQRDELLAVLKEALAWGESEIHDEYDGTQKLAGRLSELDFIRTAITKAEQL